MSSPDNPNPPVGIGYAALKCRCPACGKGKLYKSLLDVADSCSVCGLSYNKHEQGDGPASMSILVVGGLVGIAAAVVEVKFEPPLWVHAALWIPFIAVGSIVSIRCIKALLIACQYQYRKDQFLP